MKVRSKSRLFTQRGTLRLLHFSKVNPQKYVSCKQNDDKSIVPIFERVGKKFMAFLICDTYKFRAIRLRINIYMRISKRCGCNRFEIVVRKKHSKIAP